MLWIGLMIGLFIGGNLGVVTMAMFKVNRER